MRVGFVVNPIAGMGGRVGLKGTDGKVEQAREMGATPRAPDRAREAVTSLYQDAPDIDLFTYAAPMGEEEAHAGGFEPTVVGTPANPDTTAQDTRDAVRRFIEEDVDLILFVGGDGTAVDVAEMLDELAVEIPMLGIPAGVKVYSSVFGVTPAAAGRIAGTYTETREREVVDLDEEAYRDGEVQTTLRAVVRVPVAEEVQSSKQLAGGTVDDLAEAVVADLRPETTYVLGPGSTLGAIKRELGINGSPLGVDVWRDTTLLARDAGESEILAALGETNVILVSPIGGQGFIFGRGNDQISPAVIRRSSVEVVASRQKLDNIGVLRVDTGDPAVDESLRGWRRVRVGRFEHRLMKVL